MASMINRAGNVVEPTAASVAYAIMDQGGNLDSNFNAVVSFTYFISDYFTFVEQFE